MSGWTRPGSASSIASAWAVARLTSRARKRLPKKAFAGPDRTYPIPDKAHAANAKARATQAVKAGRMSPSAAARIKAKANRKLKGKR